MMRVWLIYISVFGIGLTSFILMIYLAPGPENIIIGEWKEFAWEYEKVNKLNNKDKPELGYEDIKSLNGQHLVIHEAEVWKFLPNRKLRLIGKDSEKTVDWRIKGRGNILEIKHSNNITEHYSLTELNEQKMILNFETDIQVRGIAKLTFEKIRN